MANELDFFKAQQPAHVRNMQSKAMQAMESGLGGGGFGNRISLKGSRFHLVQNGVDTETLQESYLDTVIFALANAVQRTYYEGIYDPNSKDRPTCFSHDGITPSPESPKLQSIKCAVCPQNVKGSGRQGNTKACAYKKRVVVLPPQDLEGAAYALDVNGQSMFGEQSESRNLFSFKGYFEKLKAHGVAIDAIVTRLTFDPQASVPKLHFSPIRALTEEEYAVVAQRVEDPEVQKMLKDLTNEVEMEAFEQTAHLPAPQPISPPKAPPPPPPKKEVPPKGVGGLVSESVTKKGFGGGGQTAAPKATPAPAKALSVDLESLANFDDE